MGFANMAALTHEMEDVFELLRQRQGGLERVAIDVLFQCLDALSAAVESIDETGEENIQPQALIESLRGLVRERTPEQEAELVGVDAPPPGELTELADGRRVIQISARLDEDVSMPAVRAYMVLSVIAGYGETLKCVPSPEAVDTFDGRDIDAWVVSERTDTEIQDAVASVPEVAEVHVFEAASDTALDAPDEVEEAVTAPPAPPVEALAVDVPAGEAPAPPRRSARRREGRARPPRRRTSASNKHGGSSTVRVDAERLDQLMHFMGELVLHRTQVEALIQQADVPGLSQAMQNLTRTSHALQSMVMQVRMIPVEAVFLRFPRLVRDLSTKLGKQVELQLVGKDTELDRTVVDALGDPLVHLVRNSLDHGLEGVEERVAAGKPATGTLEISARHAGGNVIITVADDGRGIDARKVAEKAAERGLIDPAAVDSIDMARAVELLFTAGFSTAEVTSDISGRGVGMDAVRAAIRGLGGEVIMTSEHGKGTSAQIRLPLTLAIMAALSSRPTAARSRSRWTASSAPCASPTRPCARSPAARCSCSPTACCRSSTPPSTTAARPSPTPSTPWSCAATATASRSPSAGMVGQHELVTRPLPPEISDGAALSGAAVLSDGQIALIVDCDAVVDVPVSA